MAAAPGKPTALHGKFGMTWKRVIKIERIARLTLDPAGYTNEQIANHLNCDKQTIVLIKQLPAFHAKMQELSTGILSVHDAELRKDYENARDELQEMIPSALNVIKDALINKKNPQLQFKAALEVLDRDGQMAKVSRTQVSVVKAPPELIGDSNVTANLIALLGGAPTSSPVIDSSVTDAFTVSATDAGQQQATMKDLAVDELLDKVQLPESTKLN